jgi:hypothetical protein
MQELNVYDSCLSHFSGSVPYLPTRVDHNDLFERFEKDLRTNAVTDASIPNGFCMQVVAHPNFYPEQKQVYWVGSDGQWTSECPQGLKQANSFKNFKTGRGTGHKKGMFFELNLYTSDETLVSNHHTTQCTGNRYDRDSGHDGETVSTKGTHWRTSVRVASSHPRDNDDGHTNSDDEQGASHDYAACSSECGYCGKCEY